MIFPILRKEILGGGRHGRYFVVRGGYLLLLAAVTIPTLLRQIERLQNSSFYSSRMGQEFTMSFGILQFILVVLLAPAFSVGAIAGEKASGGLDLLHVAGVKPFQVVSGKYLARMSFLTLFMLSGLPLFFAGTIMGGVGGKTIALLTAHCFVAGAVGTSLGFTLSGRMRQTVPALVLAYLILSAIYIGLPLGLVFYDEAFQGTRVKQEWYAWSSPVVAISLHSYGQVTARLVWLSLIPQALLAFLAFLPSIGAARPDDAGKLGLFGARRAAAIPAGGRNDPAAAGSRVSASGSRSRVYGNPVAWRDGRTARRGFASRLLRWSYFALAVLVIGGALLAAASRNGGNKEIGKVAVFLLVSAGGLVALIVGSGTIAEERERRAMPLLALSELTSGDILLGKLWGMVVYLWPIALLPTIVSTLFFAWEDPAAVGLTAILTAAVLFSASSVGLFLSSFTKKAATAAGIAVAAAILYMVIPPLVIELGDIDFAEDLLAVFNPFVTILELIDDFGRNYSGYPGRTGREDFWLSVTGMGYLFVLGVASLVLGWSTLQTREEG